MTADSEPSKRSAVVLAGGHSTRFGEADKAVADLAGTPMIRQVADRIRPLVDDLVVNCRAEQVSAIRDALESGTHWTDIDRDQTTCFAVDPVPDQGPLAGIATGLRAANGEYAAAVACDMPFVDPGFLEYLFDRAIGHDAAVVRVDEWYQPTQAVYRTDATAEACERALERGDRRIVEALADLDCVVLEESEMREHATLETFENVNTREELEAAAERLDADRAPH
ncbi:molybdenum cofactor guanylyltransferase [Natrialba swarupiae]|uniref:Probable molybdenum cofactor guanylyltransferase n=1 Tax=Natrialba swarupiae TaxID=2448032 RepID=A0A5D5AFZ2_9EURY|nr:molybdenum cofactor guanylyltransferase [Natrialba swarupiae]TYT60686.1 molybdenum cofactor guanylyltransferase [Natrialba swarupiae]